jgi:hypothetical protein
MDLDHSNSEVVVLYLVEFGLYLRCECLSLCSFRCVEKSLSAVHLAIKRLL